MSDYIILPRATVEQALEAMRCAVPTGKITLYEWDKAVSDLNAALAQQAEPVEPVGRVVSANCEYATVQWLKQTSDVGGGDPQNSRSWPIAGDAVYTAPPQRKPLTEEEIEACRQQGYDHDGLHSPFDFREAARAIERAHGIGGSNG